MYEVELKLRADHESVRAALTAAGASHDARIRQVDTYYDAPHRDFAATDEALRLRRETREPVEGVDEAGTADGVTNDNEAGRPTSTTELTYKGPLVEAESKTREEHETPVGDGDDAAAILAGLGFDPAATVEKERTVFSLDGYTVSLDRVDGLGEFVEIEGTADRSEAISDVREGAIDVLDGLGLDPEAQIRTSYLGLLLDGEGDPAADASG